MVRVAIIEDDKYCQDEIAGYLEKYGTSQGVEFSVDLFSDGDAIVEKYPADYDVLLMDIELPLLSGMNAAEEIRRIDSEVAIIFITNSPQYAIEGYRVQAMDYLLKPLNYYAFSQSIGRALNQGTEPEKTAGSQPDDRCERRKAEDPDSGYPLCGSKRP